MRKLLLIIASLLASIFAVANDLPQRPEPPTLVNDFANVLSRDERAALERKLVDYFAATSTQIAVVTVNSLSDYQISDYAFRLGEKWGVGGAKFNNGIIMVVKPKTSTSKGEAFIAVGYGLEGAVPDATAKQVVENEMITRFKNNDMYGGIESGTSVLIDLTKGEYNYQQYAKHVEGQGGFSPFIIFLVIFVIFPILFGRRRKGFYAAGGRSSLPFWLAMGMLGGSRRGNSGMFNDFSSGSGSFGGGSSFGSFGGFGGGSFGGGGAGGSW
ncbi:MAG: TPM domain-containing protein [Prolixibacteraceae bacterium]|nr:TPM domain-containing protein [Prolixibacteraceae bacterium]